MDGNISDHAVYQILDAARQEHLGIDMRQWIKDAGGYCMVDDALSRPQGSKIKRVFKLENHRLLPQVSDDAIAHSGGFTPSDSYIETRLIALDFKALAARRLAGSNIEHFFMTFFGRDSDCFVEEALTNYWKLYQHADRYRMGKTSKYTPEIGGERRSAQFRQEFKHIKKRKKPMLDTLLQKNKKAAGSTANLVAAKTVNGLVMDKIEPMLPENVRPFAKTPLGALVLANIAMAALGTAQDSMEHKTFRRLDKLADAMIVEAMSSLMAQVDLPGLIQGLLAVPGLQFPDEDEDDF